METAPQPSSIEQPVIRYAYYSVIEYLKSVQIFGDGRVDVGAIDYFIEQRSDETKGYTTGQQRIALERVDALVARILAAVDEARQYECKPGYHFAGVGRWDEDMCHVAVNYKGRKEDIQWLIDPPDKNTPPSLVAILDELEHLWCSTPQRQA
jgi:hypothetical protein